MGPPFGMLRAAASRTVLAAAQRDHRHVGLVHVKVGVEDRGVHVLALAGALAMQQCEANRHRRRHPGRHVADRHRDDRRRPVGLADTVGYRGVGLSHVVVADFVRERTALPERRNRAHDYLRIALAQFVVSETHLLDDSRRVVFHNHVDLRDHRIDKFTRAGLVDVNRKAELAVVVLKVIAALAGVLVLGRKRLESSGAHAVAGRREFDLDDLGAHLGQHARAGRSGNELGEVEDSIAFEHPRFIGHRCKPPCVSGRIRFSSRPVTLTLQKPGRTVKPLAASHYALSAK